MSPTQIRIFMAVVLIAFLGVIIAIGTVAGKVSYISADTILEENQGVKIPRYRLNVAIETHENYRPNSEIRLIPGMTAQLDIKSGTRTIFSYLTRPLTKTLDEALTEK